MIFSFVVPGSNTSAEASVSGAGDNAGVVSPVDWIRPATRATTFDPAGAVYAVALPAASVGTSWSRITSLSSRSTCHARPSSDQSSSGATGRYTPRGTSRVSAVDADDRTATGRIREWTQSMPPPGSITGSVPPDLTDA